MKNLRIAPTGIGDLLVGNDFVVPMYQRPYAWKAENVLHMLTDISGAIKRRDANKGDAYFLGTIVVVNRSGKKTLEVVDGQQRLATASIIIAAIRDYHIEIGQDKAAESYDKYLRSFHVPSGRYRPTLKLNEIDDRCYALAILEEPKKRKKLTWTLGSHKRLLDAYECAMDHVQSIARINNAKAAVETLYETVEFIRSNTQVILVTVDDEVDAFTIFETLNDRHLSLTVADLLKNFIFGLAADSVDDAKGNWREMQGALQAIKGKKDRTVDFIRQLWGSMHGLVREKDLFRDIKNRVLDESGAMELSSMLAHQASDYAAVLNPTYEAWEKYGQSALSALTTFNALRVERIRPLLLAILNRFSAKEVEKALAYLRAAAVRVVVTTGINGTVEDKIYAIAVKIHNREIKKTSQLAKAMDFVPNDKVFRAVFETMNVTKPALARFYLRELEETAKGDSDAEHVLVDNARKVDLEHIIPVAASERLQNWPELDAETGNALCRRLGNLTLMPKKKNSSLNGKSYEEKIKVYDTCDSIYLTKSIATTYETWGADEVDLRQSQLAKLALETWPTAITKAATKKRAR